MPEEQSFPLSPFAKYPGVLTLGDTSVDCYVLVRKIAQHFIDIAQWLDRQRVDDEIT